jgi:hypothetical protein
MKPTLLAAFAILSIAGCKKDPLADAPPPPSIKLPKTLEDDAPKKPVAVDEKVPGGSDEEDIGGHGPDRTASKWLRAAKSNDILQLINLSMTMSDPKTGATLDDDGLKELYGTLLTGSEDWAGKKMEKISSDRVKKFLSKNKVTGIPAKTAANANYFCEGLGGDEANVILITVSGEKVTAAVAIPYKGELP